VASAVFFSILFLFYQYYTNFISSESGSIDDIIEDSKLVSGHLVSSGYPDDWDSTNATRIGITDNNQRINFTKLSYLSEMEYNMSKAVLGTSFDYIIFFYNSEGNLDSINLSDSESISLVGKPGITYDNVYDEEQPEKLIVTSRFLIHNSSIYRMVLYLWD